MKIGGSARPYLSLLIVLIILGGAIYVVFNAGPLITVLAGVVAAITFFWMKLKHRIFYGASEILAGIYVLSQNYPQGGGGFSSAFSDGFQVFKWNVVLISTLVAVYIMVRGLDNICEGLQDFSRPHDVR
jgi:hypothetical protein